MQRREEARAQLIRAERHGSWLTVNIYGAVQSCRHIDTKAGDIFALTCRVVRAAERASTESRRLQETPPTKVTAPS